MSNLLALLVALCITSLIHNALEIWGIRQKVYWLNRSMRGLEHGRWPIDVNTKTKTVSLHAAIFVAVTGLVFLCLKLLGISARELLIMGLSVLTISYAYTAWRVDRYHAEIQSLIVKVKKRPKA